MDITDNLVKKVVDAAKKYDSTPVHMRADVGIELCDAIDGLSDKQCLQIAKIISKKM